MREQLNCKSGVIGVILTAASWGILPSARAHGKVLEAMFTPAPIRVDGQPDALWSKAAAADISICMNAGLKAQLDRCTVSGTVKAMWNGPLLYLLFTVTDADISTSSSKDTERSGVQIFVDQFEARRLERPGFASDS